MTNIKIAILGATSHIAKGLIFHFLQKRGFVLHLFTRSPETTDEFLCSLDKAAGTGCFIHEGYSDFHHWLYDAVINCIGVGAARKLKGDYTLYFTVTEEFDNLVISYLQKHPDTLYISIGSGAVYGPAHAAPVTQSSSNSVSVNHPAPQDYYGIVRLNAEAKHRAFRELHIVDLRVFAYFSRFIDLSEGYFITEIMDAILNGKVLLTDGLNMVRDYLHPEDLFSMVCRCIQRRRINTAFDVVSAKPCDKWEILESFSRKYGLRFEIVTDLGYTSATGRKNVYCSNYQAAFQFGYVPKHTSISTLLDEADRILPAAPVRLCPEPKNLAAAETIEPYSV
jgi:nucleoside-diphosphate-sugar epimerase